MKYIFFFGKFSMVEQNVYINFHDLGMTWIKLLFLLIVEGLHIQKKKKKDLW